MEFLQLVGRLPGIKARNPGVVAISVSAATLAFGEVVEAETPYEPGNYEFLERQYVFWSPQKISVNGQENRLGFEAQVGPHVTLWGTSWGPDPRLGPNDELRAIFTFQSYLRLVTSDSAPVVTPSYMPKLRLQWLQRRTMIDGDHNPVTDWRYGLTLDVWSHHSNGQDGCTYLDGDTCSSKGGATRLNERNGSFGTNHLGLNGHGRWSPDAAHEGSTSSLLGSAGAQFHHNVPGGGLDDDLRRLWGQWHFYAEAEGRASPFGDSPASGYAYLRYQIYAATGGSDPLVPSVSASSFRHTAEMGFVLSQLHQLGLFARVVTGREYYNIEFTQDVTRCQFGITIDTSGRPAEYEVLTDEETRRIAGSHPGLSDGSVQNSPIVADDETTKVANARETAE